MASWPRYLYTGVLTLLLPWAKKRLARERVNAFSDRQRAGHISPFQQPVIWAHCASVGEVLAAEPLLKRLQQDYPEQQLVVTTMTATGATQVRQRLPAARHYLLPLDLPWNTERFIHTLRPRLALIFETEIWPNLFHSCNKYAIPVMLANGRLSVKAFKAYKKIRPLIAESLNKVACVAAKSPADAERFLALGVAEDTLKITGSIKYDLQLPDDLNAQTQSLKAIWGERPVWIAASTHAGEDEPVLQAHQELLKIHPDALLILVPRHPQRFADVADLITASDLSWARRSQNQAVTAATQVYLADTLGELLFLYAAADLAFVGGSLMPIGGHNLLEPAAVQTPLITGPFVDNFAEMAAELTRRSGMKKLQKADELAPLLVELLSDQSQCRQLTQAAEQVLAENRGALAQHLLLVEELLSVGDKKSERPVSIR